MARNPCSNPRGPELVDGGANLSNSGVEVRDRFFEAVCDPRLLGCAGHALKRKRHCEKALDHGVVQVPGNPVPVLIDRHLSDLAMEASVLDGDPRRQGESRDQGLVVAGELGPADLVSQIEVAVDLVAHLDGHTQKRGHGGVIGWEAVALVVRAHGAQPKRAGIIDQHAQHPSPRRPSADLLLLYRLEPDGHELGQCRVVLVQDSERTVAGRRHRTCFFDEVSQEDLELEIAFEEQGRLEHPPKLDGILDRPKWHG